MQDVMLETTKGGVQKQGQYIRRSAELTAVVGKFRKELRNPCKSKTITIRSKRISDNPAPRRVCWWALHRMNYDYNTLPRPPLFRISLYEGIFPK
jgi:hypothetical protein